jgi:hypothetical protein
MRLWEVVRRLLRRNSLIRMVNIVIHMAMRDWEVESLAQIKLTTAEMQLSELVLRLVLRDLLITSMVTLHTTTRV